MKKQRQHVCCCVQWHRTLRVVIVSAALVLHGVMPAGYGVIP